jgi:predicted metal-dependent enzyme (double-stranded beta helix superfamily)
MLRGAEVSRSFRIRDGKPLAGREERLEPGEVTVVSPTLGDIHQVRNAFDDRVSISIHVYGGNIGLIERHVYLPGGGNKPFVSGYSTPGQLRST